MNVAPARTRATRWGALTARQRSWAASTSLKAMARPAVRLPGPFVTLVRCRTVAKVDSIGLEVSYQDATTQRGRRHAVHPPALRCLAISVSRSQAGDDAPTDVVTSWAMAGAWTGHSPPSNLPYRLAIHRWVRSASA